MPQLALRTVPRAFSSGYMDPECRRPSAGIFRNGIFRGRKAEKNGFGRAVQEPCTAALARSRNDDLRAAAIDVMRIVFVRNPHAEQPGKVIDLIDAAQGLNPPGPDRAPNLRHTPRPAGRGLDGGDRERA